MKTMILTAAAVLVLGVASAFADGEGGGSATGAQWQARNGNALVPSTEWFAASPAQRELLSHGYTVQPFSPPTNYAGQIPSHG